jgi:hypothetical protein
MKTLAVAFLLIGLALGVAHAQPPSNQPPQELELQVTQAAEKSVVFQSEMMRRVFGLQVELGGSIPHAFRSGQPWQLINPFAPAQFGDGNDNVSVDPQTGQPTGFHLLDIRF